MRAGRPTVALLAAACLAGCTPVSLAVGAGASAGVAIAEERTVGEVVEDARIVAEINRAWLSADLDLIQRLNTAVHQGRVLVTGTVADADQMLVALRLVWQVDGVREVINEITIADGGGLAGFARDSWIAAQLRTRMTLDSSIDAINYTVEVANGVVYLLGLGRDDDEVERVKAHARQIDYVRGIVSHVRVAAD